MVPPCAARLDFAAHGPGESDRPRRITMNKDAVRPHRQRLAVVGYDDALSEEEPDAPQHDSFIVDDGIGHSARNEETICVASSIGQ